MDRPAPATHRIDTGTDGTPVLVKRATDEGGRARLRAEATVLRALAHPGVAQVVAVVEEGEAAEESEAVELHLAWVGSHSLATVTGLTPTAAAGLVATLASTVADVHAAGLVHRRLSPDHVLLGPGGSPVLTGFADAVRADRGHSADDVAALGTILTGLVAPSPETLALPERRRDQWTERGWWSSSRHDRGVRGALLTLADQAQADDPAARPTAAELASLLRATAGLEAGRPDVRPTALAPSSSPRPVLRPHRTGPIAPLQEGRDGRAAHRRLPAERQPRRPAAGRSASGRSRRVVVLALILCVGFTALAATALGGPEAGDDTAASSIPVARGPIPPTTAVPPATDGPAPRSSGPAPTGVEESAPGCPPTATGAHDIDGDGCPEAVRVAGERVSVGSTTWLVGRAGDRSTVGDWDCDGTATVAVLRPATGEVFVYDRWAEAGDELTVAPADRVEGAEDIRATDPDGDGCPELIVTGPDGLETSVPPPGGAG